MFAVVRKRVDKAGPYSKIVNVRFNDAIGGADPNESFYANSTKTTPNVNTPTIDWEDFTKVAQADFPWLYEMVDKEFERASEVRTINKAKQLAGARKLTANFLRHLLGVVEG
jgi:hypothetical protein